MPDLTSFPSVLLAHVASFASFAFSRGRAVKAAKESHSAAQVASSSAVEAVNLARAAYRAATPQPSMLRTLWRMCWRIWIGSLAFVVMETVAPFLGPIALEVVADKLQQEEIITIEEFIE